MTFASGDRVRVENVGEDGLPLIRYGFVSGQNHSGGPVAVLLDGDLRPAVFANDDVRPVTITNVELLLNGSDLVDDPALRRGLLALWQAEIDNAGLAVDRIDALDSGCPESSAWPLAQVSSCDGRYVVCAERNDDNELVRVRAVPAP